MATTAPPTKAPAVSRIPARSARRANPLVLWHLLSLDAPTIAALWTWFVAAANRIVLPASTMLAVATAVWLLYATDRLLDARLLNDRLDAGLMACDQELEERHYFHFLHRRAFVFGIFLATAVLAILVPQLSAPSRPLYLALGAVQFAYFVLIHSEKLLKTASRRLPKELAVGGFFSAATFIPTVSHQPVLRAALLPGAILFAVLCSLNCVFIYTWEHPVAPQSTHPATRAALKVLPALAVLAAICATAMVLFDRLLPWPIPAACALSASLLLLLHGSRGWFTAVTLRAAADLCLLAPVVLMPFLPR